MDDISSYLELLYTENVVNCSSKFVWEVDHIKTGDYCSGQQ